MRTVTRYLGRLHHRHLIIPDLGNIRMRNLSIGDLVKPTESSGDGYGISRSEKTELQYKKEKTARD
jgi:hypothetical protein